MKKLIPLLVVPVAALAFVLGACQQSGSDSSADGGGQLPADAVDLKVTGMTWGVACVAAVQSALGGVEGVKTAKVSMPDRAVVTGSADPATLIAAVEAAGYGASVR